MTKVRKLNISGEGLTMIDTITPKPYEPWIDKRHLNRGCPPKISPGQILAALKENPKATATMLAKMFGVCPSTIGRTAKKIKSDLPMSEN